jgi:hypothetical protein
MEFHLLLVSSLVYQSRLRVVFQGIDAVCRTCDGSPKRLHTYLKLHLAFDSTLYPALEYIET